MLPSAQTPICRVLFSDTCLVDCLIGVAFLPELGAGDPLFVRFWKETAPYKNEFHFLPVQLHKSPQFVCPGLKPTSTSSTTTVIER